MKNIVLIVLIVLIISICIGCFPIGGRSFTTSNVDYVKNGTTKDQVRVLIGEPWEIRKTDNDVEVWNYYCVYLRLFLFTSINNYSVYFDNNAYVIKTIWNY